jgi:predicted Co/Zn/Cd cation transporter (cation efflux family)
MLLIVSMLYAFINAARQLVNGGLRERMLLVKWLWYN